MFILDYTQPFWGTNRAIPLYVTDICNNDVNCCKSHFAYLPYNLGPFCCRTKDKCAKIGAPKSRGT